MRIWLMPVIQNIQKYCRWFGTLITIFFIILLLSAYIQSKLLDMEDLLGIIS